MLGARRWVLDAGRWVGAGCCELSAGYARGVDRVLGAGCWVL